MNNLRKLTFAAIITGITTATSPYVHIPLGVVKAFPIQHFANVISAVLLGPWYAILQAFLTSLLRNMMGTGTIFAFPGSIIGAFLAAIVYAKTKKLSFTVTGEVIGTGILGAMATYPISVQFLGREATLFGLVPSFLLSSLTGSIIAIVLLKVMSRNKMFQDLVNEKSSTL